MSPYCGIAWPFLGGNSSHSGTQVSSQVCNTQVLSRKVPFHDNDRLALHPIQVMAAHSPLLEGPSRAAVLATPGDWNVHFLARAQSQLPIYLRGPGHLGAKQSL